MVCEVRDGVLFAIVVSGQRLFGDGACSTMAFVSWMVAGQRVCDFRAFLVFVSWRMVAVSMGRRWWCGCVHSAVGERMAEVLIRGVTKPPA